MPHPRHIINCHVFITGSQSITVVYLEQFIQLVLAESLLFFSSGVDTSGGVAGGPGTFTPTLESCQQVANLADLNNRFGIICTMAIDWIIHGLEPMINDHAQLFKEGATIQKSITFDRKAQLVNKSAGFVRFIVHYFSRALLLVIKKVRTHYTCIYMYM